jgi:hypothetical protein
MGKKPDSHSEPSRLAESPTVSEQTIKALAGHVSKQMLDRYADIRTRAKEQAIAALHASRPQILAAMGRKMGTISWGRRTERSKPLKRLGCPNPFELELSPQILQAGERLSAEIANIQNDLGSPNAVAPWGHSSLSQVEAQDDPKPQ